jgi:hypothetical protein
VEASRTEKRGAFSLARDAKEEHPDKSPKEGRRRNRKRVFAGREQGIS